MANITVEELAKNGWSGDLASLAPLATGKNPDGTDFVIKVDTGQSTLTFFTESVTSVPAMSTGTGAQREGRREFRALSSGSAAHTLRIEGSNDGVTWDGYAEQLSTMKASTQTAALTVATCTPYVRAVVVNGNLGSLTGVRLRSATL